MTDMTKDEILALADRARPGRALSYTDRDLIITALHHYAEAMGEQRIRSVLVEKPAAPAVDELGDLVTRFAVALEAKLRAAERKYGYINEWLRDDWRDELCTYLAEHLAKGDPRDVAAYCAFAWHHGWSVAAAAPQPPTSQSDAACDMLAERKRLDRLLDRLAAHSEEIGEER